MSWVMLPVGLGLLTVTAIIPSSLDAQQSPGASARRNADGAAFLDDSSLRALFIYAYVTAYNGGHDGPAEFFRADGHYRRHSWGAVVFEGSFEIRDGAVCVSGENSAPSCRRVRANGDGIYTFIDTANGTETRMTVVAPGLSRNISMANAGLGQPLVDAELRVLLSNVSVTPGAHGVTDDGPSDLCGQWHLPEQPRQRERIWRSVRNPVRCCVRAGPRLRAAMPPSPSQCRRQLHLCRHRQRYVRLHDHHAAAIGGAFRGKSDLPRGIIFSIDS